MKVLKILSGLSTMFLLCFTSCVHIIGNGSVSAYEINVAPFEEIENNGPGIIRYYFGNKHRVVLNIDSNLEKYVSIVSENNTLKIRKRNTHLSVLSANYSIDVYSPSISAISISGSGKFESHEKISAETVKLEVIGSGAMETDVECKELTLSLSGSGNLSGSIKTDNLIARSSGSGEIIISGNSQNADIVMTGSGRFRGSEFNVNSGILSLRGSGSISICVTEYMKANISGSGNIYYQGTPMLDYSGNGSGRLINKHE